MTTHEEITEIIDDMELNRCHTINIEELSESEYIVTITCDTHHLTEKVFQKDFNRISATISDFVCTSEFVEYTGKTFK